MSAPSPNALRARFQQYIEEGLSGRAAALRLKVSAATVISPFLTGCIRRAYVAIFSFMAGVMPPMPMLGRSLL